MAKNWRNHIKTLGIIIVFFMICSIILSSISFSNDIQSFMSGRGDETIYSDSWTYERINNKSDFRNLSIELLIEKPEINLNDVLNLSLRIINNGYWNATLVWPSGGYFFPGNEHPGFDRIGLLIEGPNGVVYTQPPMSHLTLALSAIVFPPGQIIYFNYSWHLGCNTRLVYQPAGNHTIYMHMTGIEEPIAEGSVHIMYDRYYLNDVINASIVIVTLSIIVSFYILRKRRREIAKLKAELDDK